MISIIKYLLETDAIQKPMSKLYSTINSAWYKPGADKVVTDRRQVKSNPMLYTNLKRYSVPKI